MNIFKHLRNIQLLEKAVAINNKNASIIYSSRHSSLAAKLSKSNNFNLENQTFVNTETEKQFLVKLKSDPDKFGQLESEEVTYEDDLKEERHFTEQPSPSQRLSTKKYAVIIKKLINQRKVKEAIDVVEIRMSKEDRVKPENYIYNLLLGACGRVGYTKKAFMLYNDMKKRGLTVTGGTYTALFNACANSPWPLTDGLTRAAHLRNIMIEKGYKPNDTNYNSMIKAFGRGGDLSTAFSLVDEMMSAGIRVKDDTINFLLQACITDKEAGFRHALLVWRKLMKKKIKPSIYSFNLLLKSVRDCGLGDVDVTRNVIDSICNEHKVISEPEALMLTQKGAEDSNKQNNESILANSTESTTVQTNSPNNSESRIANCRPNLLATIPHLGNIISLTEVTEAEHRLLLIGGSKGFLETMKRHQCSPDIKTFTQLLDCIPNTPTAEKDLMTAMKNANVKPDVDFYNMLIKRRSMRCDYEGAREVLGLFNKHNYRPDLVTYGVLAVGCKNKSDAMELIQEMKDKSYRLNAEILGAMLHQACYHFNFFYILYVMELCITENVQPNKKFLETLEEFKTTTKKLDKEKQLQENLLKPWGIFKARYKSWLQNIEIDESEDQHPWKQFREVTQGEYKYNSTDTSRFKARHSSQFHVKTSTKYRKH